MSKVQIQKAPSPNYSRRHGRRVVGTVIHYTADGPDWNPVKWLRMTAAKASAHYVILRNGSIYELVKPEHKAWHAGESEWLYDGEMTEDASAFTLGIELANAGLLLKRPDGFYWRAREPRPYQGPEPEHASLVFDTGHTIEGWWEPFAEKQMQALEGLLRLLEDEGHEAARNLIGHEEIAMPLGRKIDPGPLFPWGRFGSRRVAPKRTSTGLVA